MKQEQRELVSSLLDEAVDQDTLDTYLQMLDEDLELRALWGRYNLIGAVLRGEPINPKAFHIAEQIRKHPKLEPISHPQASIYHLRWLIPAVGMALAASVALLAIDSELRLSLSNQNLPERVTMQDSLEPVVYGNSTEPHWEGQQWPVAAKLDFFPVNHQGYYPVISLQGDTTDKARLSWAKLQLPAGFAVYSHHHQLGANSVPTEQLLLRDDLTTVSAYLESDSNEGPPWQSRSCNTSTWGTYGVGYQVPMLGEVPVATVRTTVETLLGHIGKPNP